MINSFLDKTHFHVITKNEKQLPFYILTIGSHIRQSIIRRESGEPSHQLLYTLKGAGTTIFDNKKYSLEPGSILHTPPNTAQYYYPEKEPWTTLWITFTGDGFDNFFKYRQDVWQTDNTLDFAKKFCELFQLIDSQSHSKYSSALLYSLLCDCMEFIPQNFENERLMQKLTPALRYIHENFTSDIEINKLASMLNISFEHFCRLFKAYTGTRPAEYINILRIKKAKEILTTYHGCRISEAAKLSGFNHLSYFEKLFKRIENITPSEFCRQYS